MPFGGLLTAGVAVGGAGLNAYLNSRNSGGQPTLQASNPNNAILNELLGVKKITHGHGADAGTSEFIKNKKNPGVFGGPEFQDAVKNYAFGGQGPSAAETGLVNGITGSAAQNLAGTQAILGANTGRYNDLYGNAGAIGANANTPGFSINPNTLLASTPDFANALATAGQVTQIDQGLLNSGNGARIDQNLLDTGYLNSGDDYYNTAISEFNRNALPALAERIGASGGGLQSQGFIDSGSRVAQNLLDEAARQNIGLREAASGRRAQGALAQGQLDDAAQQRRTIAQLQQAGYIDAATARQLDTLIQEGQLKFAGQESAKGRDLANAGLQLQDRTRADQTGLNAIGLQQGLLNSQNQNAIANLALGPAYANDILGLNSNIRGQQDAIARRPLDVFSQLSGLSQPPGYIQQGYNPQGSGTSQLLGSLASSLPGVLQAAQQSGVFF